MSISRWNVQDQDNDISIGELIFPKDVYEQDHLLPAYRFRSSFFYLIEQDSQISFLKPFSLYTWLSILFISVLMTVSLKLALCKTSTSETSWDWCAFTVFSTLCQQGTDPFPQGLICRLVFTSLLTMCMVLYDYYTSSIVSHLLSAENRGFSSVGELEKSHFTLALDNCDDFVQQILNTNSSEITKLLKKKLGENRSPLNEGFEKLQRGGFGFYTERNVAFWYLGKNYSQEQVCTLGELKLFPQSYGSLTSSKESPFGEVFKSTLSHLRQVGLVQRLQVRYEKEFPECYGGKFSVVSLGMGQAWVLFANLTAGGFIAMVIIVLEKIAIL